MGMAKPAWKYQKPRAMLQAQMQGNGAQRMRRKASGQKMIAKASSFRATITELHTKDFSG
jgi:hypothetical protein